MRACMSGPVCACARARARARVRERERDREMAQVANDARTDCILGRAGTVCTLPPSAWTVAVYEVREGEGEGGREGVKHRVFS